MTDAAEPPAPSPPPQAIPPLGWCAHCIIDLRTAEMLKAEPLPNVYPARVIAGGDGLCDLTHRLQVEPQSPILRPDRAQLPPRLVLR